MHPNEYSQECHYYPFTVKLDRFAGNYNIINDLSNKVCVPNKTEDSHLSVFNMMTEINESKTLTKDISCEFKCKFYETKCNSNQWKNNNKCQCECKKHNICKNFIFGNLLHVIVKMGDIFQVLWMIQQLFAMKL